MDRLELDATADNNGNVTLHVGEAGARVHVVVEAVRAQEPMSRLLDLCGIWADEPFERPEQIAWRDVEPL